MKLYGKFLAMHLKSTMAYPSSFFLFCFGRLSVFVTTMFSMVFILNRFDSVGGYTLPEILLGYGVVLSGFSTAECFGRGFDHFATTMREAAFDRLLVRPRDLIFQVICNDLRPGVLVSLLQGLVMIGYAVINGSIAWTFWRVCTLILMIIGSTAVFFGVFMLYATLCFFTLEGLEVMSIFSHGLQDHGKYPFGVYGRGILMFLTFIVPIALTQHWPLQYLIGRAPPIYGLLPIAAMLFLIPCRLLWGFGVRHYHSTGS